MRNIYEATKRLAAANDDEIAAIASHDPDMIRDVAKAAVARFNWPQCQLCHNTDPECELCGGQAQATAPAAMATPPAEVTE